MAYAGVAPLLLALAWTCTSRAIAVVKQDPVPSSSVVFQSISQRVSALETRLAEVERENTQELSMHKAAYEAKLRAAQQNNVELASINAHIVEEIDQLKDSDASMRKRAQALLQDTTSWKDDWTNMRTNLSTALELAQATLKAGDAEESAPEIAVLEELNRDDEAQKAEHERASKFEQVMGPPSLSPHQQPKQKSSLKASVLQMTQSQSPKSILKVLGNGLEDLAQQHEKQEQDLKAQFLQLMNEQEERRRGLIDEQNTLNKTKSSLQRLAVRLEAAVAALEDVNMKQSEKGRSLRLYAQRLGNRPAPKGMTADLADLITPQTTAAPFMSLDSAQPVVQADPSASPQRPIAPTASASTRSKTSQVEANLEKATAASDKPPKRKTGLTQLVSRSLGGDVQGKHEGAHLLNWLGLGKH